MVVGSEPCVLIINFIEVVLRLMRREPSAAREVLGAETFTAEVLLLLLEGWKAARPWKRAR